MNYTQLEIVVKKIAQIFNYARPTIQKNIVRFSYNGKSFKITVEEE